MTATNNNKNNHRQQNLKARRDALEEKILRHERIKKTASQSENDAAYSHTKSTIAMGFRLSADFLSAIVVGAVLGYMLDKFIGISPWGLIIFVLLGFAAGVINVLRSLGSPIPFEKDEASDKKDNV